MDSRILFWSKNVPRLDYWRYLFRTGFAFDNPFDLPFVEVHRVKEFTFHSGNSLIGKSGPTEPEISSVWNCDGELVEEPNITIKIKSAIIAHFRSGRPLQKLV